MIQYKDKRIKIRVKKCFVLHEEVIDYFHNNFYIPTTEKFSFHLSHVEIIRSMEYGKTRCDLFKMGAISIFTIFLHTLLFDCTTKL